MAYARFSVNVRRRTELYFFPREGFTGSWRKRLISDKSKVTVKEVGWPDEDTLARAAESILLLPLNWRSSDKQPVYAVSTESVAKLLSQANVRSQTLSPLTTETHLKDERGMDWVAPTLFVSSLMLSQNGMAISLALNVMGNYATDLFKGIKKDPNVKLTVVHTRERGKRSREIYYEGPASGLKLVSEALSNLESED